MGDVPRPAPGAGPGFTWEVGVDLEDWCLLIRAAYLEMPGLHMTRKQVERLWNLDARQPHRRCASSWRAIPCASHATVDTQR